MLVKKYSNIGNDTYFVLSVLRHYLKIIEHSNQKYEVLQVEKS